MYFASIVKAAQLLSENLQFRDACMYTKEVPTVNKYFCFVVAGLSPAAV